MNDYEIDGIQGALEVTGFSSVEEFQEAHDLEIDGIWDTEEDDIYLELLSLDYQSQHEALKKEYNASKTSYRSAERALDKLEVEITELNDEISDGIKEIEGIADNDKERKVLVSALRKATSKLERKESFWIEKARNLVTAAERREGAYEDLVKFERRGYRVDYETAYSRLETARVVLKKDQPIPPHIQMFDQFKMGIQMWVDDWFKPKEFSNG